MDHLSWNEPEQAERIPNMADIPILDDFAQAHEGTLDLCLGLFEISYIPLFLTGLVFLIRKFNPRGKRFFLAVLFRLVLVTELLAFAVWGVG